MPPPESRYQELTRRAFLRRMSAVGVAAVVPGAILAACGSDARTFATTASTTTLPGTTAPPSTSTTAAVTTTTRATTGVLAPGAELLVDFTYAATTGNDAIKNPYVAVWVEDEAGDLVATIALWFLQTEKGMQWLKDLRRWSTIDGSDDTITTISSATRAPGDYSFAWDGTTLSGERVAEGTYYIAIETAREHGPYSLLREPITLASDPYSKNLESSGEIRNASVSLIL